jgi:hypothetical protein
MLWSGTSRRGVLRTSGMTLNGSHLRATSAVEQAALAHLAALAALSGAYGAEAAVVSPSVLLCHWRAAEDTPLS